MNEHIEKKCCPKCKWQEDGTYGHGFACQNASCSCHIHPTDMGEGWEKRFDKLFVREGFVMDGGDLWMKKETAKSFILSEKEHSRREGYEAGLKKCEHSGSAGRTNFLDCPEDPCVVKRTDAYALFYDHIRREAFAEIAEQKNQAYRERDMLVAALSKMFPSHLARHPDTDTSWEDDWRNIVCVHLPTGQATWHIHDSEIEQFTHLKMEPVHWDGHSTEEKYKRLSLLQLPQEKKDI